MTEALKESTWTNFTKKLKLELDDGALVKALAKVEKADESKTEAYIEALEGFVEQVPKQMIALNKRKKEIGDKVFGEVKDKLYALLDEAEGRVKEAKRAGADDDEDTPVLLTTKMLPLVRELRKGQTEMHATIGMLGKETALLIMRKPIAVSRRKLLAEAMGGSAGAKYVTATCLLENKALTFVVQAAPAGGLAKRLTKALLDQVGLRMKVRVRGDAGDTDEDGEDQDDTVGSAPSPSPAPAPAPAPTPAPATASTGGASFVNMQKARLAWLQTRQAVQAQLKTLEASILEEFKNDDDIAEVRSEVRRLDQVMSVLDEELADTLDAALNAADAAERQKLQQAAREQLEAYGAYVESDEFVANLDANPLAPVKIRETVTRSLAVLSKTLA